MSAPTTSDFLNDTTPAATTGDQCATFQSDGATPMQSITVVPKRMVGDTGSGGLAGTVPPPGAGDAAAGKFLKADATFDVPTAAFSSQSPNVVLAGPVSGSPATPTFRALVASDLPLGQNAAVVRGSNSAGGNGTSVTLTFPSGTSAGDLAIVNIGIAPTTLATPTGWTLQTSQSSASWNGWTFSKVLNSTDITTGSVTLSLGSSTDYQCHIVTVESGTYTSIREADSGWSAGSVAGGNPITITTSSAVEANDLGIYFGTNSPVFSGLGETITRGSVAQSSGAGSDIGVTAIETIGSSGAIAPKFTCGTNTVNGHYASVIIVIGTFTLGSVTSVALTVPSRQSVSGSPISSAGTLAITDNAQNANLVFAGPSSGSAAAPTFRTLVSADVPGSLSNPMTTEGDIIYGGSSGTPTRLAAGTSGQVLQTNGSGAAPSWVTGGGGGGGGFSPYLSTLTKPVSTDFSWVNQGSAVTHDQSNRMAVEVPDSFNTVIGRGLKFSTAIPSAPYTVDIAAMISEVNSGSNGSMLGAALFDSSNNMVAFSMFPSTGSTPVLFRAAWNSSGSVGTAGSRAINATGDSLFFLRITDDGTTRSFYYSPNGLDYWLYGTEASNTGVTPANAGIQFYNNGGGSGSTTIVSIFHFLVSSSILSQFAT